MKSKSFSSNVTYGGCNITVPELIRLNYRTVVFDLPNQMFEVPIHPKASYRLISLFSVPILVKNEPAFYESHKTVRMSRA